MLLIFCKDGNIRYKYDMPDEREFPLLNLLSLYQSQTVYTMLEFWKNYWNTPIQFEEGLTFKEFFLNLEPWVELFQNIIPEAVDLHAFINEVKKPSLMTTKDLDKYQNLCDYISINQVTTLTPIIFRKEKNNYLPINQTNGKYQNSFQIQLTGGYKDLRNESFRIEHCPLNILGKKQIFLNRNHYYIIDRFNNDVSRHNNIPKSIFNPESYGAFELNELQDLIISERDISILDILTGAFKYFFINPQERDMTLKNLDELFEGQSLEEITDIFSQPDEILEQTLIEKQVILQDESFNNLELEALEDDIINTRNSIYEINKNTPEISTRTTINLQKNSFSHLDYNAHKAKTIKDVKFLNDTTGELK